MKNMNLYVDDEVVALANDLPKRMSASKLFRHSIKANTYDARQWAEYKKTPECQECLEFLRPIRERFGCK
jgi:hypothetical protein